MDRTASRTIRRTTSRTALTAVAWAALPVLLVAGCSSSSSSSDDQERPADEESQAVAPTPEPVRFAALPEPCATVGEDTIGEIVPEADPAEGQTLTSTDTTTSGACLWSGLREYQFRSLTVSLRRYDSDVSLGSGDERAQEFLDQMVEEVTGNDENQDVESAELAETGDAATTISYRVAKPVEGEDAEEGAEQEYRQQRVVARTGNVVVTVDYQGTGFEGDDLPAADDVRAAAETAAREAVAAVDASAEEGAATPEAGAESGGESGASGEESGAAAGDDVENDARSE